MKILKPREHIIFLRSKLSREKFKSVQFSRRQLTVYGIAFALIGGTLLYLALAVPTTKVWDTQADFDTGTTKSNITTNANGTFNLTPSGGGSATSLDPVTSPTFGSYESGNLSEFGSTSQGGSCVQVSTNNVREGRYSALFPGSTTPCWVYDSNFRIHLLGFPTGTGVSMEPGSAPFWWAYSLYVVSDPSLTFYAGPEIHQSNNLDRCTQGPAPFGMGNQRGIWQFVVRGGGGTCPADNFQQIAFGSVSAYGCTPASCRDWANGVSPTIQAGQWYDFLVGWQMASDNSGWFEAWVNGPGTNGRSIQVVPRTNLPTSYPQLKKVTGEIQPNYPMDGLYYANAAGSPPRALLYDGGRFSNDFEALKAWQNTFTNSWPTGSNPTYPASGSLTLPFDAGTGVHFSGFTPTLATALPTGTSVIYEARSSCDQNTGWSSWGPVGSVPDGRYLQLRANLATTDATKTPTIDKLSITYDAVAGVCSSPAPTPTSSINNGDTVANGTTWTVGVTPAPDSVEFWADGARLTTDTTSPYTTVINLTAGSHALGICATVSAQRTCFGTNGLFANITVTAPTPSPDTTPPSTPTGLSADASSPTNVNLSWTASTDNVAVTAYKLYRGQGTTTPTLYQTLGNVTSYSDSAVTANTSYAYRLSALDAAGNESLLGISLAVTTPAAPDTTAPSIPTGLAAASVSATTVTLSWAPSADNAGGSGLSGYIIYRNNGSIPIASTDQLTYTDGVLSPQTAYSYSVSAIDNLGNESAKSSAISATTSVLSGAPEPTPTPAPVSTNTPSARRSHGDLNSDNKITVIDLSILLRNFNSRPQPNSGGDVNGDGVVNVIDLSILLSNYGR